MASPFPNPKLGPGRASFGFEMARPGRVGLELFDSSGRRVHHRQPASFPAGRHRFDVDASAFAPGAYYARMTTEWGSQWKRWVVLK
jgi:hypothetical protein